MSIFVTVVAYYDHQARVIVPDPALPGCGTTVAFPAAALQALVQQELAAVMPEANLTKENIIVLPVQLDPNAGAAVPLGLMLGITVCNHGSSTEDLRAASHRIIQGLPLLGFHCAARIQLTRTPAIIVDGVADPVPI